MATERTVTEINRAAVTVTSFVAGDPTGNFFDNEDGTFLFVHNMDGAVPRAITFNIQPTVDGLASANKSYTLAISSFYLLGPFQQSIYNETDSGQSNLCYVTPATSALELAAFRLPPVVQEPVAGAAQVASTRVIINAVSTIDRAGGCGWSGGTTPDLGLGNYFANNGRTALLIQGTRTAPRTVTVRFGSGFDGKTPTHRVYTIATGSTFCFVGPFPTHLFNQPTDAANVWVDCDSTELRLKAVTLPG